MARVAATEFKARCLELMDRVSERRETFVITKRGKAVAKLLSRKASRAIRRAAASTGLALSSISLWELALLLESGRLRLKGTTSRGLLDALVQTPSLMVLEITTEIAVLATQFPGIPPGRCRSPHRGHCPGP